MLSDEDWVAISAEHFQVHARAETFSGPRDDRHARVAGFHFVQRRLNFGDHALRDSVALFGAVERQRRQLSGEFECQRFKHEDAP